MKITRLHHTQLTIPAGSEAQARAFYCDVLGLAEIEKPDSLKANGGFWVELGDIQIHFGVQDGVDRKASKAHLAYQVDDLAAWRNRLDEQGIETLPNTPIPGYDRVEFRDPFGNRVEFIQPLDSFSKKPGA